jgi:fructose-1,6-bisphosphatase II
MDRNLALECVRVTEAAAIMSARTMGRGDSNASDEAAVGAMRRAFEFLAIDGLVVIGEGERDEAPMLYIGEPVGRRLPRDPRIDLALDPLEGTSLCAYGRAGAISVIAAGPAGCFLHAPDIYMDKIAVGPVGREVVDIRLSPRENVHRLAEAKGVHVEDLTVIILERDRHRALIDEVRATGARIRLIGDGDVAAAIATTVEETGIDLLLGLGGAPEGVLAAAALRCTGGEIQGRLMFRNEGERERARKMMGADRDIEAVLTMDDLATGDVVFAATGVTSGDLLKGVRFFRGGCTTQSLVMRAGSGTVRLIDTTHNFRRKPNYTDEGEVS